MVHMRRSGATSWRRLRALTSAPGVDTCLCGIWFNRTEDNADEDGYSSSLLWFNGDMHLHPYSSPYIDRTPYDTKVSMLCSIP